MAFLIPLLLPHIVEAGANIGIGISNAIQGDHSNVSFQIGGKVFTSRKSFDLGSLPPELRVRILLDALQESVDYIQPAPLAVDPLGSRYLELQRQIPLHAGQKNYRSIYGDTVSANGYPISSWRWSGVCREWRDELRAGLWKDLEVVGHRPWRNLLAMIESKKGAADILKLAKTVTLREGFDSTSDLYAILSCPALDSLEAISILPDYPTPFHPFIPPIPSFAFGFQLIRTQKDRLKSLVYGLPLESSTNEASRQQLAVLRPRHLTLSFVRPTIPLFKELAGLVGSTTETLVIQYIPAGSGRLVTSNILLCEPLQDFRKIIIHLHLPSQRYEIPGPFGQRTFVPQKDPQVISEFLASLISALEVEEEEVKERYEVWRVEGWDIPGAAHQATKRRLWPEIVEVEDEKREMEEVVKEMAEASGSGASGGGFLDKMMGKQAGGSAAPPKEKERQHWDRETNLRLLGGLVNLRLESKKH
ncbi:uncharacterized protein MKK02DRAFT_40205 [Dioszegia hungarica]|uniref:Uncharacterized protein n=1 Tax=Dioszegia hungarica TaxID=4972 RepID=A0AA38HGU2_9TREE|nr:uncharacterized protein MKK02DRAFT_40205 [Dioszegia hungarica]KAI9639876.1 hypothetical protein MKK02DRAFT_40205 [Dioszegia hungarica]